MGNDWRNKYFLFECIIVDIRRMSLESREWFFIIQAHNLFFLEVFVYRWDSFPFRVLNEHRYDYPRNKMWSQGKKLWFSKVGQLEIVWHWWSISRNQICIYGFNGASSEVRSFSTLDSTVIIIIIIIIVSC